MRNFRKLSYSVLVLFLVLTLILLVITKNNKKSPLQVAFLDVGQGDSILISEGSQQLLIDGGKDGKLLLEKMGKYVPFWDRNIETIIETHPDADHIGGLISVLNTYHVDSILETKMKSDSQTFKRLEELIVINDVELIEAKKGVRIKFTSGAVAEIFYPFDVVTDLNGKETNMYSVAVKLTVGENKFLFTGDLPIEQEKEIIASGADLKSDVLKVGHHGSKYSTSEEFISAVKPVDAIISVGKNNSYGHPNQEILQRLLAHRISIFRTDESGDIIYECKSLNGKCLVESP